MTRATRLAFAGALAALLAAPAPGDGAVVAERTLRVSSDALGAAGGGASTSPVLSGTGRFIAFETTATATGPEPDPNGAVRDIVVADLATPVRRRVTHGADGPSWDPAISAAGRHVAFMSHATNLVAGDTNAVGDVFLRDGEGPVVRVSVGARGEQADGPSSQPDVSDDGRLVVFTSSASNLVPGDINGRPDVFVRDLAAGTTTLVSAAHAGTSGAPAISPDGRFVTFSSSSPDLVRRDTNGRADVFLRDRLTNGLERMSVSTGRVQQNRSVAAPFQQVSDVSAGGRLVTFDSDATNLAGGDTNRDTDVFVRDRARATTTRVSLSSTGRQGDNDSFNPTITRNGRFVAFASFAENLVPSAVGEDVFVRDRRGATTSLVDVGQDGRPRGPELVRQLLQRPSISEDGRVAVFTSTSARLVAGDGNGAEDVFVRRMDAPSGAVSDPPGPVVRGPRTLIGLRADDPGATRFVCEVDALPRFACAPGPVLLPALGEGRHVVRVRAGGPGMLHDSTPVSARFAIDRSGPSVRIDRPHGGALRELRGTASDPVAGVRRVDVSLVVRSRSGACRRLTGRRLVRSACTRRSFVPAAGSTGWRVRLPVAVRGRLTVVARAVDRAGNGGPTTIMRTVAG